MASRITLYSHLTTSLFRLLLSSDVSSWKLVRWWRPPTSWAPSSSSWRGWRGHHQQTTCAPWQAGSPRHVTRRRRAGWRRHAAGRPVCRCPWLPWRSLRRRRIVKDPCRSNWTAEARTTSVSRASGSSARPHCVELSARRVLSTRWRPTQYGIVGFNVPHDTL